MQDITTPGDACYGVEDEEEDQVGVAGEGGGELLKNMCLWRGCSMGVSMRSRAVLHQALPQRRLNFWLVNFLNRTQPLALPCTFNVLGVRRSRERTR